MKVRLYGFEIEATGHSVSVDSLLSQFENNSGVPDTSKSIERRIYVNGKSNSDYYVGLVVTVKDQKKFCKLENDHGHIKITVENLRGNNKLMEFNFFAINKSNGIGIYQHYYQSCGVNVFGSYLNKAHNEIRDSLIDEEIFAHKSSNNGNISNKALKAIKRKHGGILRFSPLVRKDSLSKILEEYKAIKAFEFEYSTLVPDIKQGMPLSKFVKKKREKVTFSSIWSLSELTQGIVDTIKQIKPKSGRVHVVNSFDEDTTLKIFDIPDNFGEEEYDDVAQKLHNLDVFDFASHIIIDELIETCQSDEYNHIFEAVLK